MSKSTGVPINSIFADQDYGALAQLILATARQTNDWTIICWHHANIPALLKVLRARTGEFPDPWNPQVFNLILQLDYRDDGVPGITEVVEPF